MSKFTSYFFKFFFALNLFINGAALADPPPAACPSPGVTISSQPITSFDAEGAQIGVDAAGNAIAVWFEYEFSSNTTFIRYATLPKQGTWSSPGTITSFSGADFFTSPQIAVSSPTGDAVAIWKQDILGNPTIQAARLPFGGGSWIPLGDISDSSADPKMVPELAINDNGQAIAVWQQTNGNTFLVSSRYNPGTDTWSPPLQVVPGTTIKQQKVAIDSAGTSYAVWINIAIGVAQVATIGFPDPAWSAVTNLSTGFNFLHSPSIAVVSPGFAVTAWAGFISPPDWIVQASTYDGANWSLPDTISDPTGLTFTTDTSVAVDQGNNAIAAWGQNDGTNNNIESNYRPAAGPWNGPIQVSDFGTSAESPDVKFDFNGNAYVVWLQPDPNTSLGVVGFATLAIGDPAWSTPCLTLSSPANNSQTPHIAVSLNSDPIGYAVMDWFTQDPDGNFFVQATFFPPLPPTITSITPTSGSTSGENTVIIEGSDFFFATGVTFGGVPVLSFTPISDNLIVVVAPPSSPPGTLGPVAVIVDAPIGPSNAVTYTYVNPICWQR